MNNIKIVKKLPKLLLTYICDGDIVELHQESLDIQKTHPQTVLQHHRTGLPTYRQIHYQNGFEFEAQKRLKSLYTIF